jgi:AbrB family looped-hinge helix DNA binding protein
MSKSVVTAKGQIVIPSSLRRKYGIKKGTPVSISDRDGEIVVRPVTDEFIRSMAGIAKRWKGGNLMKALMEEKAREREL